MSEEKEPEQIEQIEKRKPGRRSGGLYFPAHSLKEAIRVPRAIWDSNAGNPFAILDLAKKLNYSPSTGIFKTLIRSSQRYGLTEGSWQQDFTKTISLKPLGRSIVAPTESDDVGKSTRTALEMPRIFKKMNELFNGKIIPPLEVLKNTLVINLHLEKPDAEECYNVFMKNAKELEIIDELQGKKYYRVDKLGVSTALVDQGTVETSATTASETITEQELQGQSPEPEVKRQILKQIFVAHGKNIKSLEQLEKILNKFKVTYKVDEDEPHKGRPISQKVADMMKSCTSGIFIFTADEKTVDKDGNESWRPSDNVVYELGAASVLYGKKIVILKEKDVAFASDFSDLGYISFEKDNLDAKAADLMLELINLGFMELTPT